MVHEGSLPQNDKLADKWQMHIWKSQAERGDSKAMVRLGVSYEYGKFGIQKDRKEAFKWYMKAADMREVTGMSYAGHCLIEGIGVKRNTTRGMALVAAAAAMGSSYACACLGAWYDTGNYNLQKDRQWAKYWYEKAIACAVRDAPEFMVDYAKERIKEIEENG